MSDTVFGPGYAGQYDLLYSDKDYKAECDLLEEVFHRYANGPVRTILDLGCGTGNHAFPLARRGYQVTGVDRSEEMLLRAERKATSHPEPLPGRVPSFRLGDVRSLDLDCRFDAVLMMFAVLGYQLGNDDVLAALETVRRHLRPGGLFVCDVWYGPAVLTVRPGERTKTVSAEGSTVVRTASASLDTYRHLAEVRYRVRRLAGDGLVDEAEETHRMRYFFPQELALFMSHTCLNLLHICSFSDLDRGPDEGTWNALVVGRSR